MSYLCGFIEVRIGHFYAHLTYTSNDKQTPPSDFKTAPVAPLTASMCIEQANACEWLPMGV